MKNRKVKTTYLLATMTSIMASSIVAEETIIQQEAISFEKCLNVITTSENKLSISLEIQDLSDQKRIAIFTLIDFGTLTISCNGIKGIITVSTDTD